VLDLGALDETAYRTKRGKGSWLHERIASVAKGVIGIDSSMAVPSEGIVTGEHSRIIRGDVLCPGEVTSRLQFVPDVVVAGELIEHLPDPLSFLTGIASAKGLQGSTLLFTTPNATAAHNVLIGLSGRESTHVDHLCILSYKTIHTLCRRAGFAEWSLIPYHSNFAEMRARHSGLSGIGVAVGEKAIRGIEWLFPSAGSLA
jgi:hypothetical protein